MDEHLKIKIKRAKDKLIARAKQSGLYENFGEKEVRKLLDDPLCDPFGSPEQRDNHRAVTEFDNWVQTYEPS